jgi:hypothetical protein
MTPTAIAIWPFEAGSGTTIAAAVGGPSIQSFGSSASTPWADPAGTGNGYKTQYNAAPDATGTALVTGVHGASRLFVIYDIYTGSTTPTNGEVLWAATGDGGNPGSIRFGAWYNGSEIRFRMNGADILTGAAFSFAANTHYTFVFILDSPNATGGLRARLFEVTAGDLGGTASVTLNDTVSISAANDELVVGVPFGPVTVNNAGYVLYLGIWSFDVVSVAHILNGARLVAADNDIIDPFDDATACYLDYRIISDGTDYALGPVAVTASNAPVVSAGNGNGFDCNDTTSQVGVDFATAANQNASKLYYCFHNTRRHTITVEFVMDTLPAVWSMLAGYSCSAANLERGFLMIWGDNSIGWSCSDGSTAVGYRTNTSTGLVAGSNVYQLTFVYDADLASDRGKFYLSINGGTPTQLTVASSEGSAQGTLLTLPTFAFGGGESHSFNIATRGNGGRKLDAKVTYVQCRNEAATLSEITARHAAIYADNDADPDGGGGPTNYTLTADGGSYAVTGAAANLLEGKRLALDSGSYSVIGNAANFNKGRRIILDPGTFVISGQAANFLLGRRLIADPGTYAVTGAAANLLEGKRLVADLGVYAVTGQAANFLRGIRMVADPGTYSITGNPITFLKGRTLLADGGTYTLTGFAAQFPRAWRLTAETGVYAVVGQDANLLTGANLVMTADPGVFTVTGAPANLRWGHALQANGGVYAVTGASANLLEGKRLIADPGSYVVTGQAALFARGRALIADPGSYSILGSDAAFDWDHSKTLFAEQGVYVITGRPVTFHYVGALTALDIAVSLRNRGTPKRPRNWRP